MLDYDLVKEERTLILNDLHFQNDEPEIKENFLKYINKICDR